MQATGVDWGREPFRWGILLSLLYLLSGAPVLTWQNQRRGEKPALLAGLQCAMLHHTLQS